MNEAARIIKERLYTAEERTAKANAEVKKVKADAVQTFNSVINRLTSIQGALYADNLNIKVARDMIDRILQECETVQDSLLS